MSLKAIASELGLSVTTVSRALNGYEDVAEETRKRVEAEAQRRGYRPNAAARRLKTGRANAVGLVFPVSTSPISDCRFSEMLLTLDQRLAQLEIDLLLLVDKPQDGPRTLTRLLRSRVLDALIVTHTLPQDERLLSLQQKNFRFLALGRSDLPQPYAWLDVDNHLGSRLAVEACLQQGLTRIAWLGSDEATTFVRDRRQGFLDAMGAVAPVDMVAVPPSRRAGYLQSAAWLAQEKPLQAIIADSSALAEGAALAMQQANRLDGPQAVRLYAWEGLPREAIVEAPVVAIRQASERETGEQLADMVVQMLNGAPLEQLQLLRQPWLDSAAR
ncbi:MULTISPECIES: LacI family DNA-binding transcriptional regulator [Pantoea]|uniref:LacI family DNA-binding transcriptional regulator n=1 Tax=Pantoea TaxID=53335 RepID=UPI002892C180|nr:MULTISPECIES: LacI family DNA-binding transcriptional regulator [unclassified Pantoea]MCG7390720.1 LacI family transcriptional regulator [Pantoea sp. ACRSB]